MKKTTRVDFSDLGTITVFDKHPLVHKTRTLIQFKPKDNELMHNATMMHKRLLKWGIENSRDVGVLIKHTRDKRWPVPCCVVFPPKDGDE